MLKLVRFPDGSRYRDILRRIELDRVRVFSISASHRSAGTSAPPKRWRPHSAIGYIAACSAEAVGNSIPPKYGARRVVGKKLLDQTGLAEPSPTISTSCPSPCLARSQRRITAGLVGIIAGLLSFAFLKVYGEPQVDRAIAFEQQQDKTKAAAAHESAHAPSRPHA
jgi:hypothetical protein